MALKRAQIRLTPEERQEFLAKGRTIYLASHGEDGYPHLIAMWYAIEDDGSIVMTTYRKSQKVKNLQRDPRCALLLEEGDTYDKLKGVFLRGRIEIIDDEERTLATLGKIGARMAGSTPPLREQMEAMRPQARKRVTLVFRADKTRSWDHAKLGGAY
ncbi:MAG TPA: pyridoxamine 5'-phosphate oxidase family protein [Candidatus Binatia bacterium]